MQPTDPERTSPAAAPRSPRRAWWVLLVGAIVLLSIALYWKSRPSQPVKPAQAATVRTVKVSTGGLARTIRLTGSTAAKNYASLMVPQMRGRGGMRQVNMGQMVTASTSSGRSGSSSSSGSSSGSSTTSTAGSTGTSSTTASTSKIGLSGTSGAINASSSMVSSVTRFSSTASSTSQTKTSSTASSASTSTAMGSSGLGSTSDSLFTGGGGGEGDPHQLILQTLVPAGSRVKKGDVIAEFDRQYMLQRLDDFRASHVQNEAALRGLAANQAVEKKAHEQLIQAAKASLDKAKLDLQTRPVRSAIVSEELKLAVDEAEAYYQQLLSEMKFREISWVSDMRTAQLNLNQEAIELKRAELNAERLLIRTPMDGIAVMATIFRSGEFGQVREGDQVHPGMRFAQVVDQSSMIVNVSVSQTDIEQIRIGAKAQIHFDAYPDLVLPATVYSIGAIAKASGFRAQYVTQVPMVLKLDRVDPRVIPDLSVSADVLLSSEEAGTLAPLGAIFKDPGSGKPVAFVQAGPGWEKRELELGSNNNIHALVRSGLSPGTVIAAEWPVTEKPNDKEKQ